MAPGTSRAPSCAGEGSGESNLAASAVSGQTPPAGPQWVSGLRPLEPHPLAYDKPRWVSLHGFTLHAATRAGALDPAGREALLRYVLRPLIAQERLEPLDRAWRALRKAPAHAPRVRVDTRTALVLPTLCST